MKANKYRLLDILQTLLLSNPKSLATLPPTKEILTIDSLVEWT
jgi:hypothetical protein